MTTSRLKADLHAYATSLGFQLFGVTSAEPIEGGVDALSDWLAGSYEGTMGWMRRNPERRARPADHLPGAKSVIALAMNYHDEDLAGEAKIARYARGRDYHALMGKRLDAFLRYLTAMSPEAQCRSFVDTGPILERSLAQRSGLGFIGKNTLLITRGLGSWVFLAHVVTTAVLPSDAPDLRSCGQCRLCLDACPTQAFVEPYVLDARRCISYLTIEHRDAWSEELRSKTEGWVFGCDVCQEVCPHNRVRPLKTSTPFEAPIVSLDALLKLQTDEEVDRLWGKTPLSRAGRRGLVRNALAAVASLQRHDLTSVVECLTADADPVVREQAQWSLHALRAGAA